MEDDGDDEGDGDDGDDGGDYSAVSILHFEKDTLLSCFNSMSVRLFACINHELIANYRTSVFGLSTDDFLFSSDFSPRTSVRTVHM